MLAQMAGHWSRPLRAGKDCWGITGLIGFVHGDCHASTRRVLPTTSQKVNPGLG
jgi:hypothetical protein